MEEMLNGAEMESQEEHVVDNGKGIADGKGKGVEAVTSENDKDKGKGKEILAISSESDGMLCSDSDDSDDSEYFNKSFDYLSSGEEELI